MISLTEKIRDHIMWEVKGLVKDHKIVGFVVYEQVWGHIFYPAYDRIWRQVWNPVDKQLREDTKWTKS